MASDIQVAIAGSNGSMGTLLESALSDAGARVCGIDLDPESRHDHCSTYHSMDLTVVANLRELKAVLNPGAWCFVCLPEHPGVAFMEMLLDGAPRGSLVVDTFSTKTRVFEMYDAKAKVARERALEIVSINPLFHPNL